MEEVLAHYHMLYNGYEHLGYIGFRMPGKVPNRVSCNLLQENVISFTRRLLHVKEIRFSLHEAFHQPKFGDIICFKAPANQCGLGYQTGAMQLKATHRELVPV